MRWFLDFNDTLASGPLTWLREHTIPKLIRQHDLPYDLGRFERAMLTAQEHGRQEIDPRPALDELFKTMGWPPALQDQLLHDLYTNYQPQLFEDVLPFLQRLQEHGQSIYILSNNLRAPELAEQLGIRNYFHEIFTPVMFPESQPKPHRSLWEGIVAAHPEIDNEASVLIGDDPWSDGVFAKACGLLCWIVDRAGRYESLHNEWPCRVTGSLLDIPVVRA